MPYTLEDYRTKLTEEGYTNLSVYDAPPNEEDPSHSHEYETKLIVLDGRMEIQINGETNVLIAGQPLYIPKNEIHSAVAGPEGCQYIVAERH